MLLTELFCFLYSTHDQQMNINALLCASLNTYKVIAVAIKSIKQKYIYAGTLYLEDC